MFKLLFTTLCVLSCLYQVYSLSILGKNCKDDEQCDLFCNYFYIDSAGYCTKNIGSKRLQNNFNQNQTECVCVGKYYEY